MRNEELIKNEFSRICKELNLENTMDFGIINAAGNRINEFLDYIERNQNLPKPVRYTFVELIMASMNDSILENRINEELIEKFKQYITPKIGNKEWYPMVDYWIGIKSKDEFPVGYLVEAISTKLK